MKQKFSTQWISSKQPRKQRKYRAKSPWHIKRKLTSANLSKDLRKKYGRRSFPLKKGDSIRVMTGEFSGKIGKVDVIDYKKLTVSLEGVFRTKKDGTKVIVHFYPSKLQIKELNLEDKKRKEALERKSDNKLQNEKVNEIKNVEKKEFKKLPKLKSEEKSKEKK